MNKENLKKYRDFAFFVGIFFPIIFGYLIPYLFGHEFKLWTVFLGITLLIFGIFAPFKLKFFYKLWISLGNFLGFINSRIILGSIFFLILSPISFLMKILGHNPLKRNKNNNKSYLEKRKEFKIDFEKMF